MSITKISIKILLGNRMTTSEEIANMAAFLLSERSGHAGQLIYRNGGSVHLDRALANASPIWTNKDL